MYVAPQSDKDWLLSKQKMMHTRSRENPGYIFHKLWGLITEPANLRLALERVARNKGRRTGGVDGVTVYKILQQGADAFLQQIRSELRTGRFRPAPVRRVLIPKPGQPGKYRPLGIPTVKDRVVQAAVKNILEPVFEPDFYPCSYGFRPGRSVHGALEHIKLLLRSKKHHKGRDQRPAYQWVIEGDIKGCFDNISHHGLMERIRRRVSDTKVNRLVIAFLKAGVLAEKQFSRTDDGTPQGGILSPLLANIALGVLEERYERHVWPRLTPSLLIEPQEIKRRAVANRLRSRQNGDVIFFPIRYADDFLILTGVPPGSSQDWQAAEAAHAEKEEVATLLRDHLRLELSEEKTLVTRMTSAIRFLGHHIRLHYVHHKGHKAVSVMIPKDKSSLLRRAIKRHFSRSTLKTTLEERLRKLNPILRGWSNFYRHASRGRRVFKKLDRYVWQTIRRWLRRKHSHATSRTLFGRYGRTLSARGRSFQWEDGGVTPFEMRRVQTGRYRLAWMRPPDYALLSTESPVHIERRTPGSEGDARKPASAS